MAAKQQGRNKARDVKRRKLQKKHQLAKRKQKKMQPRKLKKRQVRTKRRPKQASAASKPSEPERICSPKRFAAKVLRQMPKVRMEAKARHLMKTLLTDVYNHVATEVETLSQKNELENISGSDVQTALKEAMTKELAKHSDEPTATECA